MKRDYATYQVGLKILLRKRRKILFLRAANKRTVDQPGGRIDNVEAKIPLEKIIAREVKEELGNVKYTLGAPLFQFRRYIQKYKRWVFLTVYDARFISGKIKLSPEHSGHMWIDPKTYQFSKYDFVNEEERKTFMGYFKKRYGRK